MEGKPITRFEELVAWQKARNLTRCIYQIIQQGRFSKDFSLRDQLRRASVSVMSNIAEGFDRASRQEYSNFHIQK